MNYPSEYEYDTIQVCLTQANSIQGPTTFGHTGTANPSWSVACNLQGLYDFNITSVMYGLSTAQTPDTVLQLNFGQLVSGNLAQQTGLLFCPYTTSMPNMKYSWRLHHQLINGNLTFSLVDYLFGTGRPILQNFQYMVITMDYRKTIK